MTPQRGHVYTLQQIEKALDLRDSPCLEFVHDNELAVLQTSHLSENELLAVPGFADTQWRYVLETYEWIPVFRYVDTRPITDFVDITVITEYGETEYWATPKGHPREAGR